jgi:glucose-6-phosphate 1-epimerase
VAPQTGGSEALVVLRTSAGDEAAFSLHGAQLLSWRPAGGAEQIYLSPLGRPAAGKTVRGGAPLCFPQFSERGPLPKHGFVRTSRWELVGPPPTHESVAEAHFQVDSATTLAARSWEHAFCLVLVARLGPGWLELQLQAANTGRTAYEFTAAIHTYLAVQDVRAARLQGLQRCTYEDNLDAQQLRREGDEPLAIDREIDRVYLQAPPMLALYEASRQARHVVQQGFADVVVWNPGPDKAGRLGDMPPEDWLHMLCIEAAAVARPVTLAPGKTWRGLQRLELPGSRHFDLALATPVAGA